MQFDSLITIGITTKNRYLDMEETLCKLINLRLNHIPLIIYDDASIEPVASEATLSNFENLEIKRNNTSKGLIFNRNRIVEQAETPYVISLDDDSCFAATPNLDKAIKYFEDNPHIIGLEFNNIDTSQKIVTTHHILSCNSIYAVKSYTGCGHMIRRDTFLSLGGYREYFVHMAEESDFAQRAWSKGLEIHYFSEIIVHHRRTPVARIPEREAFYNARNISLCNLLNKPLIFGFIRAIGSYPILVKKNIRYPSLIGKITIGWINAWIFLLFNINERTPMSFKKYFSYQNLPSS